MVFAMSIKRARGFLEAARLSDDWVRDMGNKALIKEAHHTTHIEGTQLTLDQAERLWNGEEIPEADPRNRGDAPRIFGLNKSNYLIHE